MPLTPRRSEKRYPLGEQQMEGFPPEQFFFPPAAMLFLEVQRMGVGWPQGLSVTKAPVSESGLSW